MLIKCLNCGIEFSPKQAFRKDRPQRFCSNNCSVKYRSGSRHPRFKNGCVYKGRHFIRLPGPDGTSKQVRAARFIMEQHLGRPLLSTEHIHHIDGNSLNDCLDNLVILSNADHSRAHASFRNDTHKECAKCGIIKERSEFSKRVAYLTHHDPHKAYCKTCMVILTSPYQHKKRNKIK
jgi:hypothetical protein